jgi:hypothetical protein
MLAGAPRPHEIAVKYVDADGREHGPYELRFDPKTAFVNETKRILEMVRWVEFREYPAGRLLAYFSSLVSRKNAFQEIRYSVDDESLDRSVHFRADWTAVGMPRISDGDETYVEIPMSTQFVAIKLFFIDGTESELKRIVLSEVGVRR